MKTKSLFFELFIHNPEYMPHILQDPEYYGWDYVSSNIYSYKYWEPYITKIFLEIFECVPKDSVKFIDIGAHIGWYSLLAATNKLNVYAFEPVSKNYDCFKQTILDQNLSDWITLYKLGLNNKPIEMDFQLLSNNTGACGRSLTCEPHYIIGLERVKLTTLDIALDGNTTPLIVKIDAEEMELEVLQGAKNQVKYIDFLMIEIADKNIDVVCKLLVDYGFKYCLLVSSDQKIKDEDKSDFWINKHSYLKNRDYYFDLASFKPIGSQVNLFCLKKLWL